MWQDQIQTTGFRPWHSPRQKIPYIIRIFGFAQHVEYEQLQLLVSTTLVFWSYKATLAFLLTFSTNASPALSHRTRSNGNHISLVHEVMLVMDRSTEAGAERKLEYQSHCSGRQALALIWKLLILIVSFRLQSHNNDDQYFLSFRNLNCQSIQARSKQLFLVPCGFVFLFNHAVVLRPGAFIGLV